MTEFNDINLPADFDDLSKHAPMLEKLRAKGDGFVVPENYFSGSLELIQMKTVLPEKDGFVLPENYFEESIELSVSRNVIPANDGFVVPINYFEDLAERIISLVNLSSFDKNFNVNDRRQPTADVFSVPENYFEKITDEIVAIASLSALKDAEAFEVPEGYFSDLDKTLNTNLALDNLKQDEGFKVPPTYFEKLSDSIISKISVEELNQGSDAEVPSGYFDTLADRIANRISEEENNKSEKTIERGRVIVFAEVLKRYARPVSIAASVALIVSVSIWFFNHSNNGNEMKNQIVTVTPKTKIEIQPVISPVKKDSVVAPQQIAINQNNTSSKHVKHYSHSTVNPEHDVVVKVEKKDIMDQIDILDVNAIADAVSATSNAVKKTDDEFLNQSMQDYLLNDNADPNELINPDK